MTEKSEMEKLEAWGELYAEVGEFLDWLSGHPDLVIGEWLRVREDGRPRLDPLLITSQRGLGAIRDEYFGIDAKKLDEERRALLAAQRTTP